MYRRSLLDAEPDIALFETGVASVAFLSGGAGGGGGSKLCPYRFLRQLETSRVDIGCRICHNPDASILRT